MFRDREYLRNLFRIAVPIMLQNLVSSSLNAVGVIMIGQLGEKAVAGVGLANQIFFLLTLMLFGISSGSAIFTAQLWGRRDVPSIHKVLGLCLALGCGAGLLFTLIAVIFPQAVLSLYTEDPAVIALGSQYLHIIGISYLATAITFSFASVLRSTGDVRVPMAVSITAICLDGLLNYTLIFGKFGFPALGVQGAALGTCLARFFECILLVSVTYLTRRTAAAHPRELLGARPDFIRRFLATVLPAAFNETLWSLGFTTYNLIYAHISTEAIAAVNIASTIESLAFVIFFGISTASAILIGNRIGANEEEKAFTYARRALALGAGLALIVGAIIITTSGAILTLYKVSPVVTGYARNILIVMGCVLWIKVSNLTVVIAILRSGGDTRFSLVLDSGSIWLIGIPLALLGAFVLHLPIYYVVLIVMIEEACKLAVGLFRFRSRKWINNLAQSAG
ncbi:MAG TPA: MATE family efflux transporter [Anaerolineaceae bacterium]|nr:MATE family efflux transporter [Anaerolineaceae bacterium]